MSDQAYDKVGRFLPADLFLETRNLCLRVISGEYEYAKRIVARLDALPEISVPSSGTATACAHGVRWPHECPDCEHELAGRLTEHQRAAEQSWSDLGKVAGEILTRERQDGEELLGDCLIRVLNERDELRKQLAASSATSLKPRWRLDEIVSHSLDDLFAQRGLRYPQSHSDMRLCVATIEKYLESSQYVEETK